MLLGEEALLRLREAVVVVAGLGGVGAYAAEMVARAGVGRMVLIDSDRVGESNKNRQKAAGHQSGTAYRESSGVYDGRQYPRGI